MKHKDTHTKENKPVLNVQSYLLVQSVYKKGRSVRVVYSVQTSYHLLKQFCLITNVSFVQADIFSRVATAQRVPFPSQS